MESQAVFQGKTQANFFSIVLPPWLSMALRMLTSHSDEVGGLSGDFEDVDGMGMNAGS